MLPDFKANHFALFGLPARFELDGAGLDVAFRQLQAQVHPDRFAHLSEADKRASLQWSTRVNEAYQVLKSPLMRAAYLLQQQGVDALAPENTQLPAVFLMQQIEWREAIAGARKDADDVALQRVEVEMQTMARRLQADLAKALDVQQDLVSAAQRVRELKFIDKIRAELDEAFVALDR